MIMSGQITLVSLGFMLGIDIVKGLFLCCTFLWSMVNLLIILLLNSKLLCWLSTLLLKRIVYFYSEFFLYKPRLILLLKEPQPARLFPLQNVLVVDVGKTWVCLWVDACCQEWMFEQVGASVVMNPAHLKETMWTLAWSTYSSSSSVPNRFRRNPDSLPADFLTSRPPIRRARRFSSSFANGLGAAFS